MTHRINLRVPSDDDSDVGALEYLTRVSVIRINRTVTGVCLTGANVRQMEVTCLERSISGQTILARSGRVDRHHRATDADEGTTDEHHPRSNHVGQANGLSRPLARFPGEDDGQDVPER
jgi:hypothetical protein